MIHVLALHLPQRFNLERRAAGMQERPVVQQFVTVNLGPRFNEALLSSWKRAADALNRIEGENRAEFLIGRVEVRPMMWRTDFWKHPDDDSEEP
jgi:hypothetical protein